MRFLHCQVLPPVMVRLAARLNAEFANPTPWLSLIAYGVIGDTNGIFRSGFGWAGSALWASSG
jgi:hypothetical protein